MKNEGYLEAMKILPRKLQPLKKKGQLFLFRHEGGLVKSC